MTENFNWSSFSIVEPYWLCFLALIPFVIWLKNKKHKTMIKIDKETLGEMGKSNLSKSNK